MRRSRSRRVLVTLLSSILLTVAAPVAAAAANPPTAPSDLSLTVVDGRTVTLSFTDRSTNEVEFVVQVEIPGWAYSDKKSIRDHRDGQPGSTGTRLTTTMTDQRYAGINCYRIVARNSAGSSNPSNERCASLGDARVPNVKLISVPVAANMVRAAGLVPAYAGDGVNGTFVINQSPAPGTWVESGSTVTLVTKIGPIP